ncbi:MAG: DUF805 domain-containing protein [Prevotella sp.]|uniref:DUF805 domain-containing protein n=1 Tax=Prevotella sp. TaxID=59823 RepID=UPI002A2F8F98|nr:DUF805 domain-containing protein [Prevotella sp.]MDD7317803.1 DUF805 domain-containing protein [Prevotellaceae bacterium]MDY4020718.1 DUF805 domain-containing protein [Prevotella sp.]
MTLVSSFQKMVFKNYCNFKGRASRSEFWFFCLAYTVLYAVASMLSSIIGDANFILVSVLGLVLCLPMLGVCWRRFHDIGKSGAWYLLMLIPVIGWIINIILWTKPSQPGSNRFGDEPNA